MSNDKRTAGQGRTWTRATKRAAARATKRAATAVVLAVVVGAWGAPAGVDAQRRCEVRDERRLSGGAVEELAIEAGAGSLEVAGVPEADGITVVATLCASSQELLDELRVVLDDSGDGARLQTSYPSQRNGWGGRTYARIDLAVEAPTGTNVRVKDGSGGASFSGVGAVRVRDGSGGLALRDVGSVVLQDGSGSVEIDGVTGDVAVEDGSGGLEIRRVAGDVVVSDGSGGIEIEGVGGTVHIERMGSGGASVRDVDGDLVVSDGRRERIRYSDIRGSLDLPPARRKGRRS